MTEYHKGVMDAAAVGATVMTWIANMPKVLSVAASALTIVWLCIQIWESKTFQRWIGRGGPKPPTNGPSLH